MHGGQCTGVYVQSLIQFIGSMEGHVSIGFVQNQSVIATARNTLVYTFLNTQCDHLLFVDGDIQFRAEDVKRMIAENLPIVVGICPKKEINWDQVATAARKNVPDVLLKEHSGMLNIFPVDKDGVIELKTDAPFEVIAGGTGLMLIQRHVFDVLLPHCQQYFDPREKNWLTRYFESAVDPETNMLLSEDYAFCHLWRRWGGKVYAAPYVETGHYGSYLFQGHL